MGTSGSYSGSGGKVGDGIRDSVSEWIASLPTDTQQSGPNSGGDQSQAEQTMPTLDPQKLLPIVGLLRSRHSSSGGGVGGTSGGVSSGGSGGRRITGGGPNRSVSRSATTAGRAAAAAYAYNIGDTPTLERLGLDYDELRALGDQNEIARRIVEAACEQADSTIEDYEQRLVAADVAEWILSEQTDGSTPTPEEIVRHTIGWIIADTILSETGEVINGSDYAMPAESAIRDAAEALAARATLSINGVTETEFARAIEEGIETLHIITGGGS
jgi:hypothetical protein